jgi:hypothetical protein
MPKHRGIVSRSRPSFEYLEERALLSGGLSGSPGTGEVPAPPSSPIPSGSQLPASPGSGGAQGSQVDSAQTPDEPSQSQLVQTVTNQPILTVAMSSVNLGSQGQLVLSMTNDPDGDTSTQGTMGVGPGLIILLVDDSPQPQIGPLPSPGPVPPPVISAPAKAQSGPTGSGPAGPTSLDTPAVTTEPETTGPVSPNLEATGGASVTVSAGREIGPEVGGTSNNGPSGPPVTSPPAQLLSLLDPDSVSVRLLSEGTVGVGGSQRAVNGAGRGSLTPTDQHGTAITGRGSLIATTDVSTALTDAQADDWPRPSSADLIASALPFDRAALDRAIDRFFQHFEDLSAGELVGKGPSQLLLYSVALASTFAALEVVHRRWWLMTTGKQLRVRHPLAISDHIGFPELPESWSSRIS